MLQPTDTSAQHRRLERIAYIFPRATIEERAWFAHLAQLLEDVPGVAATSERIELKPLDPTGALPVTALELGDTAEPFVRLDTTQQIDIAVGELSLRSAGTLSSASDEHRRREIVQRTDTLGQYIHVPAGGFFTDLLPLDEVLQRLRGQIVRVDHTGVNLPTAHVDGATWNGLLQNLAAVAALYRYPTGEQWPFILPATDDEFADEIQRFVIGRAPKFELVYDEYLPGAMIQLDMQTNLTRTEIEQRFPAPYGLALPGLEAFFRSVYVFHPWTNFTLRFDLRYRDDGEPSDWDTGKWLVTEGGRVSNDLAAL